MSEATPDQEAIMQIIETARLRHKYEAYNQMRSDILQLNKQIIAERMATYSFNQEDAVIFNMK